MKLTSRPPCLTHARYTDTFFRAHRSHNMLHRLMITHGCSPIRAPSSVTEAACGGSMWRSNHTKQPTRSPGYFLRRTDLRVRDRFCASHDSKRIVSVVAVEGHERQVVGSAVAGTVVGMDGALVKSLPASAAAVDSLRLEVRERCSRRVLPAGAVVKLCADWSKERVILCQDDRRDLPTRCTTLRRRPRDTKITNSLPCWPLAEADTVLRAGTPRRLMPHHFRVSYAT